MPAIEPATPTQQARRPIVIIGVSRRSGTNFLSRVLRYHPDCAAPAAPVIEDQLLRDAPRLLDYADRAARRWPRRWGDREEARAALEVTLGAGLTKFLVDRTDGLRPVTRTPWVDNLHLAPVLWRNADVILLVRDGRSVTTSLGEAWGWKFDRAVHEWRRGARAILELQRLHPPGGDGPFRCTVVRYEDLVNDFDGHIGAVLEFCGLDPTAFDADAAKALGVIGSSWIRDENGELSWTTVRRPSEFDPTRRDGDWDDRRRARFEWLAGREQRALGYPVDEPARRLRWVVRNLADDAWWTVTSPVLARARSLLGGFLGWRAERRWQAERTG